MKTKNQSTLIKPPMIPIIAGIIYVLSACNVVIPKWAPATEFGFNLSGQYDPEEPYAIGELQCKTELYPNIIFPTEEASADAAYLGALSAAYPGWTFNNSASSLSDDAIEIKTYDAIGTSTRVGVWIHARYVPSGSDPTDSIHWIQILTTNHGLQGTNHGPMATYIDVAGGTTTPYYDEGYAADSRDLIDRPSRSDASADHTWEATTFLVTGPDVGDGAGTVTLLGPGFTWGWKNTCEATDGLQEYYYYAEKQESIPLETQPAAGGKLRLTSVSPEPLVLGKEKSTTKVSVNSKELVFNIGKEADVWGEVPLTLESGNLDMEEFAFNDKRMSSSSSRIKSGSGYLNLYTGEAAIEYTVSLAMPDGETKDVVFTGSGQYDKETNTFRLNSDLKGISQSFRKSNIPIDSRKDKEEGGK